MVRGFAFIKIYVYLRFIIVLRINGYRFYFFMDTLILKDTSLNNTRSILSGFQDEEVVNIYSSAMDALEKRIHIDELRIRALHFHHDLDLILVVLNNKKVLTYSISSSQLLADATEEQRNHYELIGKGIGVHWPDLDEDLSLKSFLQEEIIRSVEQVLGKTA